jgi:hypothetical protein
MSESYDIYFAGKIVEGFDEASVRENVARLFKADEKTLARLFSGTPQLVKRGVDKPTALKYKTALNRAGAVPVIRAAVGTQPTPAPASETPPSAAVAEKTVTEPAPDASGRTGTLAERLAALTGESAPAAAAAASPAAPATTDASGQAQPADTDANLSLAPVGSDVLKADERPVVEELQIDTSAIELAEAEDDTPLAAPAEPPPPAPDTSHLAMGEVGEVIPHIETVVPLLNPDVSHLSMGEVGEPIPHLEIHRQPVNPDISGIDLAPEGSDLLEAQYRRHITATAPNTDHLSLEA